MGAVFTDTKIRYDEHKTENGKLFYYDIMISI